MHGRGDIGDLILIHMRSKMRMKTWAWLRGRVCISSKRLQECQDMELSAGENNLAAGYWEGKE